MTGRTLTETAEDLLQPAQPPSRHEQAKAARGARLWSWIARGVGLVLLACVVGLGVYLAAANAGARAERFELLDQIEAERALVDAERAKVDALYEQLRAAGKDPVVSPSDESPAPQGIPGRTPSALGVLEAVNLYCASVGGCRGGVSVTGVSCVLRDDLSTAFRFAFSDASTVDVPGACLP